MKKQRIPKLVTAFVLLLLYVPVVILILSSFNPSKYGGQWTGFSLKWYWQLLEERELWEALQTSLIVASSATFIATILGTLSAFALHMYRSRLQTVHYGLVYTPLVLPDLMVGISLLIFFLALNVRLGLTTVIITHVTFCMSYVTMVLLGRLRSFDYAVVEAAQDLGATWPTIIRKVVVPVITPAIISGALLAFTISLDDFIITFFVTGPGANTLPLYVYSLIKFGSTPIVNALSALLLVLTAAIVYISQRLAKDWA